MTEFPIKPALAKRIQKAYLDEFSLQSCHWAGDAGRDAARERAAKTLSEVLGTKVEPIDD